MSPPIRFVIFVSYGNDSIALVQWAKENNLTGVALVYTDTGWAADGWAERVEKAEAWAQAAGFQTFRTSSIGFRQLARDKKGFPTQRFQWCSYILKIQPGERWLADNDPDARAICVVGVRREESADRKDFPAYLPSSGNHGGRFMLAPFVDFSAEQRNELLARAGWDVLPHRSRECRCINSNRRDLKRFTEADIAAIEEIEGEVGRPMYRPHRHMGAVGAREVVKWANSPKGSYVQPAELGPALARLLRTKPDTEAPTEDAAPETDLLSCTPHGYCEVSEVEDATAEEGIFG